MEDIMYAIRNFSFFIISSTIFTLDDNSEVVWRRLPRNSDGAAMVLISHCLKPHLSTSNLRFDMEKLICFWIFLLNVGRKKKGKGEKNKEENEFICMD